MRMLRSLDDGSMYLVHQVDEPAGDSYEAYEVADTITLSPEQLTGNNDIGDLLVRTGQAQRVTQ